MVIARSVRYCKITWEIRERSTNFIRCNGVIFACRISVVVKIVIVLLLLRRFSCVRNMGRLVKMRFPLPGSGVQKDLDLVTTGYDLNIHMFFRPEENDFSGTIHEKEKRVTGLWLLLSDI